ncbi:DUF4252 domain-containing protein [uncultured Chryseobacterium sp.]|uniref:DUF4252 domain-containing protein n=1 Tax=uncultured Chryseobacterium sp. TaxID=259322 RepID=UPI0025FA87B8|nr:DUF4252 domain-containing protein [uncultured Chryseobacterium sp.]
MKNIFSILIIIISGLVTFSGQTEKLDQLFQELEKSGGGTSIDIKKPMFKLLNNIDIDDEYMKKIKPVLNEVDGLKLLIIPKATFPENLKSENIENIRLNQEKSNRINKALQGLNFSELMSINNDGTSMKFLAETEKGDFLQNLVFNVNSDEEIILFILNGKIKMADVNKIISSMETTVSPVKTSSSFVSQDTSSYLNGENRNVGEFSGINVSTGVNLVFKQEDPASVKVIADADKLQYIVTKVENGVLKVYVDNKGQKNLKFKNINVNVSSPRMNNLKVSSGAIFTTIGPVQENNLTVDGSSGAVVKGRFDISGNTKIEASSGTSIKVEVNSKNLTFKGSSGSDTSIAGETETAAFDISSGAVCKGENFSADHVEAESTSGASLSVSASRTLKAKASSGGLIKYRGNPEITADISKMSGGTLKPIN